MSDAVPDFAAMTAEELADWQYAHRDRPLGVPLGEEEDITDQVRITKPLGVTMSFRTSVEEAQAIREAAAAAGTSLSEWIRWAAMRAARDTAVPAPRHAAISRARELLQQAQRELGSV